MGLFKRDRRKPAAPAQYDPYLQLLTVQQAERLRYLVRTALAEQGLESTMYPDYAVAEDGRQIGLDNVMRHCAQTRESEWPAFVRTFIGRLLSATEQDGTDELPPEHVLLRLAPQDCAGTPEMTFDYAPAFADDLSSVLVVDRPQTVAFLTDSLLAGHHPLGPWLDRGRANLHRLMLQTPVRIETLEHEGAGFECVLDDCVYTASFALLLPEALRLWRPGVDLSDGVLFCVPFRHQFAWAVCSAPGATLAGLQLMPPFALNGFSEGVAPLSPHVYYWRDGQVDRITEQDGDHWQVHVRDELADLLERDLGGGPAR